MWKLAAELAAKGLSMVAPEAAGEAEVVGARLLKAVLPEGLTAENTVGAATESGPVEDWLAHVNKVFHESPEMSAAHVYTEPIDPFRQNLERAIIDDTIPQGKIDLLEIGPSGTSTVPYGAAERLNSYTGVDMSSHALRSLRATAEQRGVDTSNNYYFIKANGLDQLPIKPASQDVVYMAGATDAHLPWTSGTLEGDPLWTRAVSDHALAAIKNVLRPGGKLISRPLYEGQAEELDWVALKRHFSSAEVRAIPEDKWATIKPFAKYPDLFSADNYRFLVLTK